MTRARLKENIREKLTNFIILSKHLAAKNPILAKAMIATLRLLPGLQSRLDRIGKPLHRIPTITKQEQLSPNANAIYEELRQNINARKGTRQ
jgi:hypothetical protein